ncbi:MAG: hypothetical protein H7Z12_16170 [Rhodospirillaceae bacterium]|nr:hypothetical protein [Rhodospirillales bacterium]
MQIYVSNDIYKIGLNVMPLATPFPLSGNATDVARKAKLAVERWLRCRWRAAALEKRLLDVSSGFEGFADGRGDPARLAVVGHQEVLETADLFLALARGGEDCRAAACTGISRTSISATCSNSRVNALREGAQSPSAPRGGNRGF